MERNKSMKKIIIIVTAIVLAISLIGVAIFFAVKNASYEKTSYGNVKYVDVQSENTLVISCSAPYMSVNTEYEIDETKTATITEVTTESEKKSCSLKIDKIEYARTKTDKMKTGNILIYVTVDDALKIKDGSKYEILISDKMITEKKSQESVGEIKQAFSVSQSSSKLSAKLEKEKNYTQTAEVASCDVSFEKEDGKYYIVAKIGTIELTRLNEEALKDKKTAISFAYDNDGIKVEVIGENIKSEYDKNNQMMILKTPVDENKLIKGKEYVFYLAEGLIISPDGQTASENLKAKFTFMG